MSVKSLEKVYGAGASWDSPDVQEDVSNKAMAVLRAALAGMEVKPEQMKAMELVMSKRIWRDSAVPKTIPNGFTRDRLEKAMAKVKKLSPSPSSGKPNVLEVPSESPPRASIPDPERVLTSAS